MFDKTRSGQIDLFGFSALWDFLQQWRGLFQHYDRDRSGSISSTELSQGTAVRSLAQHATGQLGILLLVFSNPPPSLSPDGLQPQPPVFGVPGAALGREGPRHTAGPLHPGVHPAAEHDAGVQGKRHEQDGQRVPQL